jgi:hypothetical protein
MSLSHAFQYGTLAALANYVAYNAGYVTRSFFAGFESQKKETPLKLKIKEEPPQVETMTGSHPAQEKTNTVTQLINPILPSKNLQLSTTDNDVSKNLLCGLVAAAVTGLVSVGINNIINNPEMLSSIDIPSILIGGLDQPQRTIGMGIAGLSFVAAKKMVGNLINRYSILGTGLGVAVASADHIVRYGTEQNSYWMDEFGRDFIKDAAYVGLAALLSFGGSALAPYYRLKMLRKETENLKKQIKVLEEVKSLKEAVQELKNKTQSLEE